VITTRWRGSQHRHSDGRLYVDVDIASMSPGDSALRVLQDGTVQDDTQVQCDHLGRIGHAVADPGPTGPETTTRTRKVAGGRSRRVGPTRPTTHTHKCDARRRGRETLFGSHQEGGTGRQDASSETSGDFVLLLIWSFFFVAYLMVLFQIFGDLFRDWDLSGQRPHG
jgi:hypothetical protein